MTSANVLPAIKKYRDFFKWASAVEQAGKETKEPAVCHSFDRVVLTLHLISFRLVGDSS